MSDDYYDPGRPEDDFNETALTQLKSEIENEMQLKFSAVLEFIDRYEDNTLLLFDLRMFVKSKRFDLLTLDYLKRIDNVLINKDRQLTYEAHMKLIVITVIKLTIY